MVEDQQWCVYIHISPSNKAYIGITSGAPEHRWQNGAGVCVETGVIYACAYTVESKLGIKNVGRVCDPNSGRHTAGGRHWRYATEGEVANAKNIIV